MTYEVMGIFTKLKKAMGHKDADVPEIQGKNADQPKFSTSPELMCGIRPGMTKDKIKEHLANLYRRHNRAASSLEDDRRKEAEMMLDAIVICRQKYVDLMQ